MRQEPTYFSRSRSKLAFSSLERVLTYSCKFIPSLKWFGALVLHFFKLLLATFTFCQNCSQFLRSVLVEARQKLSPTRTKSEESYFFTSLGLCFIFVADFLVECSKILLLVGLDSTSFFFMFKKLLIFLSTPNKYSSRLKMIIYNFKLFETKICTNQSMIFIIYHKIFSTMKTKSSDQFVNIKLYDFIQVNPTAMRSIFAAEQEGRLYVSRENCSEIYEIDASGPHPVMQQIAELEHSQYILSIGGILALYKPFQLRLFRHGRWEAHSFTTQLLSIRVAGQTVYSFHQKETIAWHMDQDDFSYKFLTESNAPYHLDIGGTIVGFGKKVRLVNKQATLTTCQVIPGKWVIVGDNKGSLHVYDWKLLSHVKTFSEHQGPVLAIKIDELTNSVYFSGSDSKVCMLRLVNDEWKLGVSIRGQSHDILNLERFGKYLISGGLTTDLCFYQLESGEFDGQLDHKVSYCGSNRVDSEGKLIIVNQRNNFEIWQLGSNLNRTELLVKYEMPADKFIVDCNIYRELIEEKAYLILVVTDQDTIGWKFNPETGLQKYITIENQYVLVQLLPKHSFYGIRVDGLIQKVSCANGRIQEIGYCEVQLPTDLLLLGGGMILIGSKISNTINIFSNKAKEVIKKLNFAINYTYVDQISHEQLVLQFFNIPILYRFVIQTQEQSQIVKLPVSLIRFGGWLGTVSKQQKQVKARPKKYWFGASQGKLIIVPNLLGAGKKKVRSKQTDRIAQVIKPSGKHLGCNLAIIPYNFRRMIDQMPIRPVFTKKIV